MRSRKEKIKLKLKGKEIVEVIWSTPLRFAFLIHLILRIIVEVTFFMVGFNIQGKSWKIGGSRVLKSYP